MRFNESFTNELSWITYYVHICYSAYEHFIDGPLTAGTPSWLVPLIWGTDHRLWTGNLFELYDIINSTHLILFQWRSLYRRFDCTLFNEINALFRMNNSSLSIRFFMEHFIQLNQKLCMKSTQHSYQAEQVKYTNV